MRKNPWLSILFIIMALALSNSRFEASASMDTYYRPNHSLPAIPIHVDNLFLLTPTAWQTDKTGETCSAIEIALLENIDVLEIPCNPEDTDSDETVGDPFKEQDEETEEPSDDQPNSPANTNKQPPQKNNPTLDKSSSSDKSDDVSDSSGNQTSGNSETPQQTPQNDDCQFIKVNNSNLLIIIKGVLFEFVYIPRGEYLFGLREEQLTEIQQQTQNFVGVNSLGVRNISIRAGYWLLKDEITRQQYFLLTENKNEEDSRPMSGVSWKESLQYCEKFQKMIAPELKKSGYMAGECRLPSEIEWECAARGLNSDQTYPWGNVFDDKIQDCTKSGIRNLSASLSEWCLDEFRSHMFSILTNGRVEYVPCSINNSIAGEPRYRVEKTMGQKDWQDLLKVEYQKFYKNSSPRARSSRSIRGGSYADAKETPPRNWTQIIPIRRSMQSYSKEEWLGFRMVLIAKELSEKKENK